MFTSLVAWQRYVQRRSGECKSSAIIQREAEVSSVWAMLVVSLVSFVAAYSIGSDTAAEMDLSAKLRALITSAAMALSAKLRALITVATMALSANLVASFDAALSPSSTASAEETISITSQEEAQ